MVGSIVDPQNLQQRFNLNYQSASHRRLIGTKEVVIHCHHYNARLQNIIEGTPQIEGKAIILNAAEEVFADYIQDFITAADNIVTKWQVAAQLYAHLGYGSLDFSRIENNLVTAHSSHYVEGWKTGFQNAARPICTFTEGYLQGIIYGITGEAVFVTEISCTNAGDDCCQFEINRNRTTPINFSAKKPLEINSSKTVDYQSNSNINEQKIIDTLVEMPFIGNQDGLIPAFNVYLANTPADFYNLICIRFLEAMDQADLYSTAKELLLFAGEVCALNTLRGILISPEWFELIAPMVQEEADCLYGLIAVTNALGWGNWHILEYEPAESLILEAHNGYEACGYLEYRGRSDTAQCLMLTGVSTGIMELMHGEGTVEERIGTYVSEETSCMCSEQSSCVFEVEIL
ncbi:MAG: V4R domain-containing protein [Cyanobacteria bacterium P01_G01_bin.67]